MGLLNPTEAELISWCKVIAHPVSVEAGLMATSLITTAFKQLELANAILAREVVALREFKKGVEADAAEAERVPTSGQVVPLRLSERDTKVKQGLEAKRAFDAAVAARPEAS